MSKYKLIGSYDGNDISMKKIENTVVAQIPLKNEGGLLVYIENILNDLRKKEIYPTEDGFDIIALAILVYLADTRISRIKHAEDSWTREIAIELPVSESVNQEKFLTQSERQSRTPRRTLSEFHLREQRSHTKLSVSSVQARFFSSLQHQVLELSQAAQ